MNDNSVFTKEHTEIAKGVAIILMLMHHLFTYPDRIKLEGYISILQLKGTSIEVFLGGFGKICVGMYLFLSGYGMYFVLIKKGKFKFRDSYNKLKDLYFNYWVVFIIFIPIGFIFFNNKFNLLELIFNFTGLISSYNKEWWFFRTYVELIILFPITYKILGQDIVLRFIKIFLILSMAFVCNTIFKLIPALDCIKEIWAYNDICNALYSEVYNILLFSIGYLCAQLNLYKRIKQILLNINCDNKIFYFIIIISVIIAKTYNGYGIFKDPVFVPIFIFAVVNTLYKSRIQKIFNYLGKHSTNMWLTHGFFCYYYFQGVTFYPKISILILIWLIVLSLSSSYLINYVSRLIKLGKYKFQSKCHEEITLNKFN